MSAAELKTGTSAVLDGVFGHLFIFLILQFLFFEFVDCSREGAWSRCFLLTCKVRLLVEDSTLCGNTSFQGSVGAFRTSSRLFFTCYISVCFSSWLD